MSSRYRFLQSPNDEDGVPGPYVKDYGCVVTNLPTAGDFSGRLVAIHKKLKEAPDKSWTQEDAAGIGKQDVKKYRSFVVEYRFEDDCRWTKLEDHDRFKSVLIGKPSHLIVFLKITPG